MGKPVLTTRDAAIRLGLSGSAATQILGRLKNEGLARRIFRGLWTLDPEIDPLSLPEFLTAPFPAYVSLQSALFFHGMIGQVPQVIYAASLGPTRRIKTSMGTYSIHRLAPGFFGGYETIPQTGIRLAAPEKALLDVLYLAGARSRLFARLPELALPADFDRAEARRWVDRIGDPSRRTMVRKRLEGIFDSIRPVNRDLRRRAGRPRPPKPRA
jgi:predicted transcriptional regulator of viral defense system